MFIASANPRSKVKHGENTSGQLVLLL
jgi:hypothetical protein